MDISWITPDQLGDELDQETLSSLPLNHTPTFLKLSQDHLKDNFHIINRTKYKQSNIEAGYFKIITQNNVIFLPLLKVENLNNKIYLSPSSKMGLAFISKDLSGIRDIDQLQQQLNKAGVQIQAALGISGFDLVPSLLTIFSRFDKKERRLATKIPLNPSLQEREYLDGKPLLDLYKQKSIERKEKETPFILTRDNNLFQRYYPDLFKLVVVKNDNEETGVITHLLQGDCCFMIEVCGNSLFYREHIFPAVAFHYLKYAKSLGVMRVYFNLIDWCNFPFIRDIIVSERLDVDKFAKIYYNWKARGVVGFEV